GPRTRQTTELCKPNPAFRDLLAIVQSIFALFFRRFESDECHASGWHLFASRCGLFVCWNCPASQSSAAALQSRHLVRFSIGTTRSCTGWRDLCKPAAGDGAVRHI